MFLRKKLWQCLLIPYISYLPMCILFFGAGPNDFPATDIAVNSDLSSFRKNSVLLINISSQVPKTSWNVPKEF